jgi:hypothetical protein
MALEFGAPPAELPGRTLYADEGIRVALQAP